MRLSVILESRRELVVYKWMAGNDWILDTLEGNKQVGDMIIPLWVGTDLSTIGQFASLVNNNISDGEQMYLAVIKAPYLPDTKTDRVYMTNEYDDVVEHDVGEPAIQGEPSDDEMLIMYDCRLIDLYVAVPDEQWDNIVLYDRDGNEVSKIVL